MTCVTVSAQTTGSFHAAACQKRKQPASRCQSFVLSHMSAIRLSRQGVRNRPPATRNRSRALPARAKRHPHRSRDLCLSLRRYGPQSPADEPAYRVSAMPTPNPSRLREGSTSALPQAGGPRDLLNAVKLVAAGWATQRRAWVISRKAAKTRRGCALVRRCVWIWACRVVGRLRRARPLRVFASLRLCVNIKIHSVPAQAGTSVFSRNVSVNRLRPPPPEPLPARRQQKRERLAPLPLVLSHIRQDPYAGPFSKVAKFSLPTKPNFVTFASVMIFIIRFAIS